MWNTVKPVYNDHLVGYFFAIVAVRIYGQIIPDDYFKFLVWKYINFY